MKKKLVPIAFACFVALMIAGCTNLDSKYPSPNEEYLDNNSPSPYQWFDTLRPPVTPMVIDEMHMMHRQNDTEKVATIKSASSFSETK